MQESGNNEIADEIVRLCETFLLIPRLSWFVEVCLQNGLETTLNLDLESVLTQLEVEFASAEEEYEVLGDPDQLMPANWKRRVSNHRVVRTTQSQLEEETHSVRRTVDSTTRDSTVRIDRSFEDKEDDAITKFIAESCGCTLGPKKSPCSSELSQDTITLTRKNCLQLTWSDLDLVIMGQLNALRTNVADKASSY